MAWFIEYFDQLLDILYKAVRIFGTVMLAVLIGLTGFDVTARYIFNNPVLGSNEMTQFLLGAMIFAGFAMVAAHRSHIVVSIFETILNRHIPFLYKSLVAGFNLIGIIAVTFIALRYTRFQFLMQAETELLEFKWWQLGSVFTVLGAVGILFAIKALKTPRRIGEYKPYKDAVVAQKSPIVLELVEGKEYVWCACGLSKSQPFCDGSHAGTEMKPIIFVAKSGGLARLCACKRSTNAPYCNGAHNDF